MNRLTAVGISMGTAAFGVAIGYICGQSKTTIACTPSAPLYEHVKEEPAKEVVQQEVRPKNNTQISDAPIFVKALSPEPAKASFKPVDPRKYESQASLLLLGNGKHCAWIHRSNGQWKAESLVHFGQAALYETYGQAVQVTRERWCGK